MNNPSNHKIPNSEIQRLKQLLGAERTKQIIESGLSKEGSKNGAYICPEHSERTPSFKFYPEGLLFKCFGCDYTRDIIEHFEVVEGLSFIEAIERLAELTGEPSPVNKSLTPEEIKKIEERRKEQKEKAHKQKVMFRDLTEDTIKFNNDLLNNASIYNYIINEWGFKAETIEKYRLGYIQEGNIRGLNYKDRILIPYIENGSVKYIVGRASGSNEPKYLAMKNDDLITGRPLFNREAIENKEVDNVYIVEGEKDCITLLQAGFNAVSFSGSNLKALKEINSKKYIKKIYVIPDNDEAGTIKANQIGELLGVSSLQPVYILSLDNKETKDINDYYNADRENFISNIKRLTKEAEEYRHSARPFELTETGNAKRLVYHYGKDLRYRHDINKWLMWNGHKWEYDEIGRVMQLTDELRQNHFKQIHHAPTEEVAEAIQKFITKSGGKVQRENMLSLAKIEPGIGIQSKDLDNNRNLLNCKNGTIDLRTGEFKPNNKGDLITKCIDVEYDTEADCPMFKKFLNEIMKGDTELVNFIQRALGYMATGEIKEDVMFIAYGGGSNGKSVLLDTLKMLLTEDYSAQVNSSTLTRERAGGEASPDLARLEGIRLATASETKRNQTLNEQFLKHVTGDEKISCRFLHGNEFEYNRMFKIILATNSKPEVNDPTDGFWRRIVLIPFNQKFYKPDEVGAGEPDKPIRDEDLSDKLKNELPGILNFLVEGAKEWYKNGLQIPDSVREATEGYRHDSDLLQSFIDDWCEVSPGARTLTKDLYEQYKFYLLEHGELRHVVRKDFVEDMKLKGFKQGHGTGNQMTIFDVRLLTHEEKQGRTPSNIKPKNNKVIPITSEF